VLLSPIFYCLVAVEGLLRNGSWSSLCELCYPSERIRWYLLRRQDQIDRLIGYN